MPQEQWFAFRAYNEQSLSGYGTEAEAAEYCDILNAERSINVYGAYPLSEAEAKAQKLDDNTEAFNLDDALAQYKGLR